MAASSSTMRTLCMRGLPLGGMALLLRGERNFDDEPRAHGEIFFHADGTVVVFDDAAHDSEAEPGAALLCGEIRQEEFFFQFGSDTVSGVSNHHLYGLAAFEDGGSDVDLADER